MTSNSNRFSNKSMFGRVAVTLVMVLSALQTAESYLTSTLSTFAGVQSTSGAFGGDGGPATSAKFDSINSIWADSLGSVFVTDQSNFRIRKIASDGIISSVYGTGSFTQSGDNGKATSAGGVVSFVFGDSAGHLYFSSASFIRIVDLSSGIVTFLAGADQITGDYNDGAPATSAFLNGPRGLALDTASNLYFASMDSDKVRMITATNKIVTTIGGTGVGEADDKSYSAYYVSSFRDGDNGQATAANLILPYTLFLTTTNDLYVSEYDGKTLRMIDLDTGIITKVAGRGFYGYKGDGGSVFAAEFDHRMCVGGDDDGTLFITSSNSNVVRYIDSEQVIDIFAGTKVAGYSGDGGPASQGKIRSPAGVFAKNGVMYIADQGNNVIRAVTYDIPKTYSLEGTVSTFSGTYGAGDYGGVKSVFVDSQGLMYVSDKGFAQIYTLDSNGLKASTVFGTTSVSTVTGNGGPASAATGPTQAICGDSSGMLYTVDGQTKQTIRRIDTTSGIITAFAGSGPGSGDTSDGIAGTSAYIWPWSCVTDTAGDVYFANINLNNVRKVAKSSGIITTVAGDGNGEPVGHYYNYYFDLDNIGDNGPATSAPVSIPTGVFLDTAMQLYIAEYDGKVFRKVDMTTGIISLVAGNGYIGSSGDGGPATSARLGGFENYVTGDLNGNVFLIMFSKHYIRHIDTKAGKIYRFAGEPFGSNDGGYQDGVATSALLNGPGGAVVHSGIIYVPEVYNGVIRAISYQPLPSSAPTVVPTALPSVRPSAVPSISPSALPSVGPSVSPSVLPTVGPSALPSVVPTVAPSVLPSVRPSITPSTAPSVVPSLQPSEVPTVMPTNAPSVRPTRKPTRSPTIRPSRYPTVRPTKMPTEVPTVTPTQAPTVMPSIRPSEMPTAVPTAKPTRLPTLKPSVLPTVKPSRGSLITRTPTASPSAAPTRDHVDISFDTDIYLHNVTENHLDSFCQIAVTNAVAVTLDIDTNHVTYLSQQLIGTEGGAGGGGARRRLSASEAYQIMVSVNVWASTRDFEDTVHQDGAYLYEKLSTVLDEAVNTNEFAQIVRDASVVAGAEATRYVGQVNLTRSDFVDVTSSAVANDDHGDNDLSRGDFAGVVIGVIVAALVLVFCCYYAFVLKGVSGAGAGGTTSFTTHEAVANGHGSASGVQQV